MKLDVIRARVVTGLTEDHRQLCVSLLKFAAHPEAFGIGFGPQLARRLDEVEAQLANPGPLVDRVIAALEAA